MEKRIWKVVFGVFIVLTAGAIFCSAGQRGGGRAGFRGRGDVNRPFEFPQEFIDKILAAIKAKDPAKAKELEALRVKDPAKFREQLISIGQEQFKTIWDEAGGGFRARQRRTRQRRTRRRRTRRARRQRTRPGKVTSKGMKNLSNGSGKISLKMQTASIR